MLFGNSTYYSLIKNFGRGSKYIGFFEITVEGVFKYAVKKVTFARLKIYYCIL